jgi:hypothetical protein
MIKISVRNAEMDDRMTEMRATRSNILQKKKVTISYRIHTFMQNKGGFHSW